MAETPKTKTSEVTESLSEAERMARIRDLLVGPVIADETVKRDESFARLDRVLAEQASMLSALRARMDSLEQAHRAETEGLQLRLLGVVEALLADESTLQARLERSEGLRSRLDALTSRPSAADKSDQTDG